MAYEILVKPWAEARQMAIPIRFEVFVNEQNVPQEMELDSDDDRAWHALILSGENALGTARLVVEDQDLNKVGRIGRMAVLKEYRQQGIGADLLKALINFGVKQGIHEFYLHAQLLAQAFYVKEGFVTEGEIFEEAGILHQAMRLKI